MSNPDTSSAEWIAEAPSAESQDSSYQVLPLADFGKVTFTNASATSDGHTGTISDPNWSLQQVQLTSPSGSGELGGRWRRHPRRQHRVRLHSDPERAPRPPR